jgi:hypothetical protein
MKAKIITPLMKPKLITPLNNNRATQGRVEFSLDTPTNETEKTSVRDANLLLSIADICNSEIKTGGLCNLWRDDLTLPTFPFLSDVTTKKSLTPRSESLGELLAMSSSDGSYPSNRIRSVSIDVQSISDEDRTSSPVSPTSPMLHSRRTRLPPRKQSLRLSSRGKFVVGSGKAFLPVDKKSKSLQTACPKGVSLKKIQRKKFSWKNYSEVSAHD